MTDPKLKEFLQKRLNEALPGQEAHDIMKAKRPTGDFIRFNERTDKRMGGVMILLYQRNKNWHFPVIKRPEYDGIHGGQISLPGGKVEHGDTNLVDTALREMEEEIGVESSHVKILGNLSQFYIGASNYEVLPVVGILDYVPQFVPEPTEVDEVIEIPLRDLLDHQNLKEREISVRGVALIAPYFDIRSQFIWGATAMMLNEFKMIIKEHG